MPGPASVAPMGRATAPMPRTAGAHPPPSTDCGWPALSSPWCSQDLLPRPALPPQLSLVIPRHRHRLHLLASVLLALPAPMVIPRHRHRLHLLAASILAAAPLARRHLPTRGQWPGASSAPWRVSSCSLAPPSLPSLWFSPGGGGAAAPMRKVTPHQATVRLLQSQPSQCGFRRT